MLKSKERITYAEWLIQTVLISLLPCLLVFLIELLLHPQNCLENTFGHGELVMVSSIISLSSVCKALYALRERKEISVFFIFSVVIIAVIFVCLYVVLKVADDIAGWLQVLLSILCPNIAWIFSYMTESLAKEGV